MTRRVLFLFVGSLLLVTALLKFHSFLLSPFVPQLLLPYRWQVLALILVEFLLALWFLSGQALAAARLMGMLFFSLAGLASLYMIWIGQTSCGCFGKINTNPWVALTIDLAALILLFFIRSSRTEPVSSLLKSTAFQVALGTVVILGLAIELFFLSVDDPERVLAQWRGDIITINPSVIDAGSAMLGEKRQVTLRIHNYSDRIVDIVGGTSTCSCVAIESLPVNIRIGAYKDIKVIVGYKGTPGQFIRQFVVYTDHPSARVVYVSFRGEVLAINEKPG